MPRAGQHQWMAMRICTAPEPVPESRDSVFLAGGITGCPEWQEQAMDLLALRNFGGTILNPRRNNFPIDDPNAAPEQIGWEYEALRAAHSILFWFPKEQVQPIALFELGRWSMTDKPIYVGAHPDYPRRLDVVEQTKLARPDVKVHDSLEATVNAFYDSPCAAWVSIS